MNDSIAWTSVIGPVPENREYGAMLSEPIWDAYATRLFPPNLRMALMWSVWLRQRQGDFTAAITRAVSYFLNGLDLTGDIDDAESRQNYVDLLINKHDIMQSIYQVGMDLQFTGNSFTSVIVPITRVLRCPHCHTDRYLRTMTRGKDYDYNKGEFVSTCSACKRRGKQTVVDFRNTTNVAPFRTIYWNPMNIDIDYCALVGAEKIKYTPNKADRSFIDNKAESIALEELPMVLLNVIENEGSLQFNSDSIKHLKLPSDALMQHTMGGWGTPRFLTAFKYVVMLMLLERQLEAAVKDFVLPLRIITPTEKSGRSGSDPMVLASDIHMTQLKAQVENILRSQAMKQSSWHMLPVPVEATSVGGDAKAIVPVELLQYIKEQLLDTQEVPVEFYKNSIMSSAAATPFSLRTFEQSWGRDVKQLNNWIAFYLQKCTQLLGWPSMEGTLLMNSVVYDPARLGTFTNLYASGKISESTYFRAVGLDANRERRLRSEDMIIAAKDKMETDSQLKNLGFTGMLTQASTDEAMNAAAGQGQAPAGDPNAGGMAAGPVGGPVTPPTGMTTGDPMQDIASLASMQRGTSVSAEQIQSDAQAAAQIMIHLPVGAPRNQLYSQLRDTNETLYAATKSIVTQMENQARQQGVEAMRAGQM